MYNELKLFVWIHGEICFVSKLMSKTVIFLGASLLGLYYNSRVPICYNFPLSTPLKASNTRKNMINSEVIVSSSNVHFA